MEEMKNGMISEEALDEVAGGLKVDKAKLTKALKAVGVGIGVLGAVGGTGAVIYGAKKAYDKSHPVFGPENKPDDYVAPEFNVGDHAFGGVVEEVAEVDED